VDRWSTRGLPREDRGERVQALLSDTHLPWDLLGESGLDDDHESWVRRTRIGDISILESSASPCTVRRGRAELSATDGEWLIVVLGMQGETLVDQGGRTSRVGPDGGAVLHSTRPVRLRFPERVLKRYVLVPARRVEPLEGQLATREPVLLRPGAPSLEMLRAFCGQLARGGPLAEPADRATAGHVLVELLRACVRPHAVVEPASLGTGIYARACAHIEERLGDRALRPPAVAADLGISVRTLQAAFAGHGDSVSGHIRELRLQRAYADVTAPAPAPVTAIAYRWAFASPSHFSRAFKARFGVAPRDLHAGRPGG
jgi:AraC-like DNA-binding protein